MITIFHFRCSYGNIKWCVTLDRTLNYWIKIPIDASKLISNLDDTLLGYTETKQVCVCVYILCMG